jgi:hypothetical protein
MNQLSPLSLVPKGSPFSIPTSVNSTFYLPGQCFLNADLSSPRLWTHIELSSSKGDFFSFVSFLEIASVSNSYEKYPHPHTLCGSTRPTNYNAGPLAQRLACNPYYINQRSSLEFSKLAVRKKQQSLFDEAGECEVGTIGNHGLPFWGNLLQKLT